MKDTDVDVLIAGAGPVGLALAAYLGQRGVDTLVVERGEDRVGSAKMIVVSMRTMEFCRQLGVADQARNWGFPLEHGLDSVFVTSMQGYELGRVKTPPLTVEFDTPHSPERERPCPQTWFDPILQKSAKAQPSVRLEYRTALAAFRQDETGVDCELTGADGGKRRLRAKYLVGCDGYASTVREALGIEVRGEKHLDVSMSVYVSIPDLRSRHRIGEAYRYVFVGEAGVWCVLTTIDGHDFYRVQLIGRSEVDVEAYDVDKVLRQCLGEGIDYEVVDVSRWVRKSTVADRFIDHRVLLAGDAAHAHPPNGGLGMNTGILDAWDLGWKLWATLEGWGGAALLESYDYERRPAAAHATYESLKNYHRLVDASGYPGIADDTPEAQGMRADLGRKLVAENERAWRAVGIHIGHVYWPSPVVVNDDSPPPSRDTDHYVPSTRPGARAPHVWLNPGESTLDLFGPHFTLLKFDDVDTAEFDRVAGERGMPWRTCRVDHAEAAKMYERRLVLVRPDGHVAWRGDALPEDVAAVVDAVRGAGPRIGSRGV